MWPCGCLHLIGEPQVTGLKQPIINSLPREYLIGVEVRVRSGSESRSGQGQSQGLGGKICSLCFCFDSRVELGLGLDFR